MNITKEKILNSNQYKRYKFYVKLIAFIFLFSGVIIEMIAFIFDNENATQGISPIAGIGILSLFVILSPPLTVYSIKMIKMRRNVKNYQLFTGKITEINSPAVLLRNHRKIAIFVSSLNEIFLAKVYKGPLYNRVTIGVTLELAINNTTKEVIVL